MDWQSILFEFLPIIIFVVLFFLIIWRRGMKRKITLHMLSAFKLDFPDHVEMKVSQDKAEIDEWEMTFRNTGYRVSRRTEEIDIRMTVFSQNSLFR